MRIAMARARSLREPRMRICDFRCKAGCHDGLCAVFHRPGPPTMLQNTASDEQNNLTFVKVLNFRGRYRGRSRGQRGPVDSRRTQKWLCCSKQGTGLFRHSRTDARTSLRQHIRQRPPRTFFGVRFSQDALHARSVECRQRPSGHLPGIDRALLAKHHQQPRERRFGNEHAHAWPV